MKKFWTFLVLLLFFVVALILKAKAQDLKGQITLNQSELATWFIGFVITGMCGLLYRLLTKLEDNQIKHSEELKDHGIKLTQHDMKINEHGQRIENLEGI